MTQRMDIPLVATVRYDVARSWKLRFKGNVVQFSLTVSLYGPLTIQMAT